MGIQDDYQRKTNLQFMEKRKSVDQFDRRPSTMKLVGSDREINKNIPESIESYEGAKYRNQKYTVNGNNMDADRKRFLSTNTNPLKQGQQFGDSSSLQISRKPSEKFNLTAEKKKPLKGSVRTEDTKSRQYSKHESSQSIQTIQEINRKNSEIGDDLLDPNIVFQSKRS